jgi:uncharacterized repeat protein (TIGR03803 family)
MTRTEQTSETRLRAVGIALAVAVAIVLVAVGFATRAQAQTFTVLYAFTGGTDGGTPYAGLIQDTAGNLYGTTYGGGGYAEGALFKLDKTGKETVLYSFGGVNGEHPYAGLVRDSAGNLYGTTTEGGSSKCGVVFKVDKSGKETLLYSFTGAGGDGANPYAGLVRDTAGNLYGTTSGGGSSSCSGGCGVVFKVDNSGKETVLYSFTGTDGDGANPWAGLILDARGNLYGTTVYGGAYDEGTVFKLNNTDKESVLYSFGGVYGANPYGGLVRDAAGNLYGTTFNGGEYSECYGGGDEGCGVVFKLAANGKETVLHSFCSAQETCKDGANPYAGLVRDAAGNLYGTTYQGGSSDGCDFPRCGTVFKVYKTGKETVLHSFIPYTDGYYPYAGLVRDAAGNLYGTTSIDGPSGYGTVFKLTP